MEESNLWFPVVCADECSPCEGCGEPVCPRCDTHYADCGCPGPTQDDHEYEVLAGMLWARKLPEEESETFYV